VNIPRPLFGCALLAAACGAPRTTGAEAPLDRTPEAGMVVCEHPLAASVGADVLEAGGNAADAAVATALALAVVLPRAGNLGGGGFALVVPREGAASVLDFRETAPRGATRERYVDAAGAPHPEWLRSGPLSVGVPGTPAGIYELWRRCGSGRFTFEELARPAIELARGGFDVDRELASDLRGDDARATLAASPGAAALFYPGGVPLAEGARLVQPELASTLEHYAAGGPTAFYGGETAARIAAELDASAREGGPAAGWIDAEDLAAYESKWREPLRGWFRGREILTAPPPSSGGIILLQVLAVLDGFPLDAERRAAAERAGERAQAGITARALHWWIEALRGAFADRARTMGDPDFVDVPVADLLSPATIAERRMQIGEVALERAAPPSESEGRDTTHLSVVDAGGDAVSLTTTLNSSFGSGILVRGAGFLLNDELDDFAFGGGVENQFRLVGGAANAIEPGKRPLSSMTPTVVRDGDGRVELVLGSRGGPRIATSVIAVVLRVYVLEQPLADAVAAPRFHQQWSPPATLFEPGWPTALIEALRRRAQEVEVVERRWSSVQAIRVHAGGRVEGVCDPRSGGAAIAARPPRARERRR
jgi:gamma-glutamyltranspeptidase/glutathione hydrolase